jgi:cell division protein FtsB
MIFATVVLVADAIFGQKGVLERMRVRRQYEELRLSVDALKQQNRLLREEARRLREDPTAIEAIARRELGLVKPGELLFIVKDVPASSAPGSAQSSRRQREGDDGDKSDEKPKRRGSPERSQP